MPSGEYEKLRTFLRIETCCNNLSDFHLKKALDHLPQVSTVLRSVNDRFAQFQAATFNVHIDFPLFQRLALPITCGTTRVPGIKIQDSRMLRLMETLLHCANQLHGFSTAQIHCRILSAFSFSKKHYSLTQLRYDLRKMKARGLIRRNGTHYRYCLTEKGIRVCLMFVLFHKRVCGPLANTLFNHQHNSSKIHDSKMEKAYRQAYCSIQKIIDLLAA